MNWNWDYGQAEIPGWEYPSSSSSWLGVSRAVLVTQFELALAQVPRAAPGSLTLGSQDPKARLDTGHTGRCPSHGRGWNKVVLKVHSNRKSFMIL